ncbi:MAG: GDSL-type esterase/lipase family protein [Flavobacteriales bacterium]|nr:GDSL-type esterase/lipase family protein [Flavobacteriales bacterium]
MKSIVLNNSYIGLVLQVIIFTVLHVVYSFFFSCIWAQVNDYPYMGSTYSFIQYQKNGLIFPSDSSDMQNFYKKLDQLIFQGKGKINIVHMGGSHVQADIISGRVRERLSNFYPSNKGSRGLVFPFKVAGTNNPYNYVVNYTGKWESCKNTQREKFCELGLTGVSITTRDTTSSIFISLKTDYYQSYDFNHIRIFHKADTSMFSVVPVLKDTTANYRMNTQIDKGITDIYFDRYYHHLTLEFKKTDSLQWGYTLYGIQLENEDPGITYHAIGVNGASTSSYLRCQLLPAHLREIKPDLVIMGIGINDAAGKEFEPWIFENNYRKLIDSIRAASPGAAILLITNNDSYKKYRRRYYVNKNGPVVRESMLKLAKEKNLAVWDFFTVMGGLESMETWMKHGLGKSDRVHFTTSGYKLMGDLLFEALLKHYEYHVKRIYQPSTEKR